ncbi:TPA: thioredoxin family protein [archaeon]|uniref:Thioredoxin family protein n=1 Tax=Candidatus Naiadarchaeum limnaeum TaxID=2756139 RepID=A0A832USM5_9ARCH|nr:thioredoxin family protein [Candidatus Naiadarchaeales archaeon SRR2090153.bin1042]HIK00767.1 thioredoxin family protein [Candidatus Naiadarchaeum limnaeum]
MAEEQTQKPQASSIQLQASSQEPYLLDFYGTECVPCKEMEPLLEQLENELGVKVQRLEVWHNAANAALMEQYDKEQRGFVPFYYNKKTGKALYGTQSYETFKKWALGQL